MNRADFNQHMERVFDECKMTMFNKRAEYVEDKENVFHNFISASEMVNGGIKGALWGMLVKHLISIKDMVLGGKKYPYKQWREKTGDAIAYMVLLDAMVREEENEKE